MDILSKPKDKIKVVKYYSYMNTTIYVIIALSVLLLAFLIFLWDYYIPSRENLAIKVNYIDDRDPSKAQPPSTTNQDLALKSVGDSNLQSPQNPSGLTAPNSTGNYDRAQLKQFCSMTDNSSAINLPSQFKYQQCDIGLVCTPGILEEGPICLADLNQNCNNLSDCVPGTDACIAGKCSKIDVDKKINVLCQNDSDCQLNDFGDQINNHICYKYPGEVLGHCKFNLYPFDGGCQNDSECPIIGNHQIKCVQTSTYKDTIMTGTLMCSTGDTCQNGEGLSLQFDDHFNMEYLEGANGVFRVNLLPTNIELADIEAEVIPFTISNDNIDLVNRIVWLDRLEFQPYDDQGLSPVYIAFGDMLGPESFIGQDVNTGGPYGICLDLLPIGAPSDYKIANVTIPAIESIPTKNIDGRIARSTRIGPGKLNDFCLNNVPNNTVLGCGTTEYQNQTWQLECGYNYSYEEVIIDNLFYGLSAPSFDIKYLGSCMIKNTLKDRQCNNSNNGCLDPLVCLPILDPITNNLLNYCVPPMRSQICENNICPDGYTCDNSTTLPFCLSNKQGLAVLDSDCSGSKSFSSGSNGNGELFDISVYNIQTDKYYSLDLTGAIGPNFPKISTLYNSTLKISSDYQTVDKYPELGINERTRLPSRIMVYGVSDPQNNNITSVTIFPLTNGKYNVDNSTSFELSPAPNNVIDDISFAPDNQLAIVQKRTIDSLREIGLGVVMIKPVDDSNINNGVSIFLEQNDNQEWFRFYMLRKDQEYDFYLQSGVSPSINKKFTGKFRINQLPNDGWANVNYPPAYIEAYATTTEPDYQSYNPGPNQEPFQLNVIVNTNKLAFNNGAFNTAISDTSVWDKDTYNYENTTITVNGNSQTVMLPSNFDGGKNQNTIGENFFYTPEIYRNSGTAYNANFTRGYTSLETGDRIVMEEPLWIYDVNSFAVQVPGIFPWPGLPDGTANWKVIDISSQGYLYVTKLQENYYVQGDNTTATLGNYIINLSPDDLSSEGAVPIFGTSVTYNQNIGPVRQSDGSYDPDQNQGIDFTLYKDMVNYNVNFIEVNYPQNGWNIQLNDNNTFLEFNKGDFSKYHTTNGINNSISYNFEPETKVKFDFYSNNDINYMLIHSAVKGVSSFFNYTQKVEYSLFQESFDNNVSGLTLEIFLNSFYNISNDDGNNYDYFYTNTNTFGDSVNYNLIKFKYLKEVIAPYPKSLYFDTSRGVNNLVNSVEENLFDGDDNTFSVFTTFKNDQFLEESGYVPQEVLGINSQNIYSNKAPPIASYSRYDEFEYSKDDNKISIDYKNSPLLNTTTGVEIDSTIGLSYSTTTNCVDKDIFGNNPNTITLRDPDAIGIFLNNPSSEIIIQKQGMSLEAYYLKNSDSGISTVLYGADFAAKKVNNGGANRFDGNGIGNLFQANQWYNNGVSPLGYNINYPNSNTQGMMQSTFTELNRTIVAIDEYNIYLDEKGNVNEYLVIKLNAQIDINDEYTQMIFNFNGGKGWKFWPYNFAPLSYYNDLNLIAYSNTGQCYVDSAPDFEDDMITIMDGSVLYTSTKGSESILPQFFSKTSYNKLAFIDPNGDFSIFNTFDNYYFKKDVDINTGLQTDINNNTLFVNNNPSKRLISVSNLNNYNNADSYIETSLNILYAGTAVMTPFFTDTNIELTGYQTLFPSDPYNNQAFTAMVPGNTSPTNLNQLEFKYNQWQDSIGNGYGTNIKPLKWLSQFSLLDDDLYLTAFLGYTQNIYAQKSIPKKVKLFNISQSKNIIYEFINPRACVFDTNDLQAPWNGIIHASENITTSQVDKNFQNNSFVYFKKRNVIPYYTTNFDNIVDKYTLLNDTNPPIAVVVMTGNQQSDYIYAYNDYNDYYKGPPTTEPVTGIPIGTANAFNNTITSAPTRPPANSFKLETITDYENSFVNISSPIKDPNNIINSYHGITYTIDGKFELTFASGVSGSDTKASRYNFVAQLEMRPQYSSTIAIPAQFLNNGNYSNTLYIINDLFLSSLPKNISGFNYNNLNIIDDKIISNVFYVNTTGEGLKKYYKNLGRIKFSLNCSSIVNKDGDLDELNLINYEEIKFPSWFTERYVSRFNSIPRIKQIFTTLKQGNAFDNLRYYAYLSYSTIEDIGTVNENDQILYLTTDVNQETMLENRGIPFTKSLSEGVLSPEVLERIFKFEPYNGFLFVASYWCF